MYVVVKGGIESDFNSEKGRKLPLNLRNPLAPVVAILSCAGIRAAEIGVAHTTIPAMIDGDLIRSHDMRSWT